MQTPLRPIWLSICEGPRNSTDCRRRCESHMRANDRRLMREISKSGRRFSSAASQKETDGFRLLRWGRGKRQRESRPLLQLCDTAPGGNAAGLLVLKLDPANRRLH